MSVGWRLDWRYHKEKWRWFRALKDILKEEIWFLIGPFPHPRALYIVSFHISTSSLFGHCVVFYFLFLFFQFLIVIIIIFVKCRNLNITTSPSVLTAFSFFNSLFSPNGWGYWSFSFPFRCRISIPLHNSLGQERAVTGSSVFLFFFFCFCR